MGKRLNIRRGDTKGFYFQRKMDGKPITEQAEKIYFSVKENDEVDDVIFQKTIDNMEFDDDSVYHFVVNPEDTDGIDYGDYVYDLEVVIGNYKKTISIGTFEIESEVTFPRNEV